MDEEIITINNNFLESNYELRMEVALLELNYKPLDSINGELQILNDEILKGIDITRGLELLIPQWKLNFDSIYSVDYFNRVDKSFEIFKKLDFEKDSVKSRNIFNIIKYEMINRFLVDIDGPCSSLGEHKVITSVKSSNTVKIGEEVQLKIGYGVMDERVIFNVYLNGYKDGAFRSDLITDTIESNNGIAELKYISKLKGDSILSGVVSFMTRNGPVYYPFSKKITTYE